MDYMIHVFHLVILLWRKEGLSQSCHPNGTNIICENIEPVQCTLQCDSGFITIVSAYYGRTDVNRCSLSPPRKLNCISPSSNQIISESCNNKTSCVVRASFTVFGDPCYGTWKYVSLVYACSELTWMSTATSDTAEHYVTTSTSLTTLQQTSTYNNTGNPQKAAPSSYTTGIIVAVVIIFVVIFICVFALLYRRLNSEKKDPPTLNIIENTNDRAARITTSTSNNDQPNRSDSVYHQYSEVSPSSPKQNMPDYRFPNSSSINGSLDYQNINCDGGFLSKRSNLKCESYFNGRAYFILDPSETGFDGLEKSHVPATKPYQNCDANQLAQSRDRKGTMDSIGQYGDMDEYSHVQNTNQTTVRQEELYDRVTDGLYDVSSHERRISSDNTYDHFNAVK